jgi:hypothetical protein
MAPAEVVGRSPWIAADAPVGLARHRRASGINKNHGSRGTLADEDSPPFVKRFFSTE